MDFEAALSRALDTEGQGGVAANAIGRVGAEIYENPDGVPGNDGNTVDMDVERNQFADNAIRYEAGITLINSQIRNMMAAIQGGQ